MQAQARVNAQVRRAHRASHVSLRRRRRRGVAATLAGPKRCRNRPKPCRNQHCACAGPGHHACAGLTQPVPRPLDTQVPAAIRIQTAWRCHSARSSYLYRRALCGGAATVIQRAWRLNRARNELNAQLGAPAPAVEASAAPAAAWPVADEGAQFSLDAFNQAADEADAALEDAARHAAATVLQAAWRGYSARWSAFQERAVQTAAAEVIQEAWRRWRAALYAAARAAEEEAARRAAEEAARLAAERQKQKAALTRFETPGARRARAAAVIQAYFRGSQARRALAALRTRAMLRQALAAPGPHAAVLQPVAASAAEALMSVFTERARSAKFSARAPPLPAEDASAVGTDRERVATRLARIAAERGEAAALEDAMREALAWSDVLLPRGAGDAEGVACTAAEGAFREAALATGPAPGATHRLAHRMAAKVAADVAGQALAPRAQAPAALLSDKVTTAAKVREAGRRLEAAA